MKRSFITRWWNKVGHPEGDANGSESRGTFVAILITDGELDNTHGVAKYVTDHFTPPKGFVLIQVGGMSALPRFCRLADSKYTSFATIGSSRDWCWAKCEVASDRHRIRDSNGLLGNSNESKRGR